MVIVLIYTAVVNLYSYGVTFTAEKVKFLFIAPSTHHHFLFWSDVNSALFELVEGAG